MPDGRRTGLPTLQDFVRVLPDIDEDVDHAEEIQK